MMPVYINLTNFHCYPTFYNKLIHIESEYDIREKINKFRCICGTIHRKLRNKTRHSTRTKFYKTIAIPTLIYASEAWMMGRKESGKIQSAEVQFLRNTLNYTLQDRIKKEDIRAELEVKDISEIITFYRRQWWDHLQRMKTVSYTHLDVYKRQVYNTG